MAYQKVPVPSELYHLTKAEHLSGILEDGKIRRFGDTECWFCESLSKMKAYMEQTVMCEGKPYYAVGGQLCRYPKFVPEDYILLKLKPLHSEERWYRWEQELPHNSPKALIRAAKEFSALKVGYRGDLDFRNAEIINVSLFLTDGIVQSESVQTAPELEDILFERIDQEQRDYTDSLCRMTQGQLIANAEEIAANHFCYNEIHTIRLSREDMLLLLSTDEPLAYLTGAWMEEHSVGSSDEFVHATVCLCEELRQREQPEVTM